MIERNIIIKNANNKKNKKIIRKIIKNAKGPYFIASIIIKKKNKIIKI